MTGTPEGQRGVVVRYRRSEVQHGAAGWCGTRIGSGGVRMGSSMA